MRKILLITLFFFSANMFSQSEWAVFSFSTINEKPNSIQGVFLYTTPEIPIKPQSVTKRGFGTFSFNSAGLIKEMENAGWELEETDMATVNVAAQQVKLYFKKEE